MRLLAIPANQLGPEIVVESLLCTFRSFHSSFLLFGGVGGERRGGEGLSMIELEIFEGGELESDDISVGSDIDWDVAEDSYYHKHHCYHSQCERTSSRSPVCSTPSLL